jgi:hypothetical protein
MFSELTRFVHAGPYMAVTVVVACLACGDRSELTLQPSELSAGVSEF